MYDELRAIAYNETRFNEWVAEGKKPAMLHLYETLLSLGFKTVFLTGTAERFKDIRTINLHNVGYKKCGKTHPQVRFNYYYLYLISFISL